MAEHSCLCLSDTKFIKYLNSKTPNEILDEASKNRNSILFILEGLA